MKTTFRIFLVFFTLITVIENLSAQGSNQSKLSIGMRHGINFSKIIFEPPVSQDLNMGYNGGLVIKYMSETHAGIQAEFNYSERGWTEKFDTTMSYKRKLNYFEVPILSHFTIGKNRTKVIINAGPNLSYFLSDKEDFKLLQAGDTLSYYMRPIDRKFELGLVGGIGMVQETGIGDFQLEFRFHYGLQNIFFANKVSNLDKSQNQLYSVSLSYFFLKKDFRANKKDKNTE
jgi:hypothetical protein